MSEKKLCECVYVKPTKDNPIVSEPVVVVMASPRKTIMQCLMCGRERVMQGRKVAKLNVKR